MQILKNIKKAAKQVADWKQLIQQIRPIVGFDEISLPPVPDYEHLPAWAAHPLKSTKVHFTPNTIPSTDHWKNGQVDCFFIPPTVYFSPNSWNASLEHLPTKELIDEIIITGQASVFNSCCRIFVPRYRQATFYSFLKKGKNSRAALTVAGNDIIAAFDTYLEKWNEGRPFFLAGHSQGALHTIRLLEQRIHTPALQQQLVAAYPIGFRFPMDKFKRTLSHLQPAANRADLHRIIAWDTLLDRGKPLQLLDSAEMCYWEKEALLWERRKNKPILGSNLLDWTVSKDWTAPAKHKGGVHIQLKRNQPLTLQKLIAEDSLDLSCVGLSDIFPGLVKTRVGHKGYLYVSVPSHRLFRRFVMPGKSLHLYDIALFYMDLRENIETRWEAYQQTY